MDPLHPATSSVSTMPGSGNQWDAIVGSSTLTSPRPASTPSWTIPCVPADSPTPSASSSRMTAQTARCQPASANATISIQSSWARQTWTCSEACSHVAMSYSGNSTSIASWVAPPATATPASTAAAAPIRGVRAPAMPCALDWPRGPRFVANPPSGSAASASLPRGNSRDVALHLAPGGSCLPGLAPSPLETIA